MPRSRLFRAPALLVLFSLPVACSSSSNPGGGAGGAASDAGRDSSGPSPDVDDPALDAARPETPVDSAGDAPKGGCNPHKGDECDMVRQNCGPTEICEYDQKVTHNTCQVRTFGPAQKGELCDAKTPCDRGLFCYQSRCSPACCIGDNSPCGKGGECKLSITDTDGKVVFNVCTYASVCHPFKYDCAPGTVCLFSEHPDIFKCAGPSPKGSLGQAPGGPCKYVNDCGESQTCTAITTGPDAGAADPRCYLFCNLSGKETDPGGASPKGRFAANGTCTVGGKSYGTCTALTPPFGSGLGLCVP